METTIQPIFLTKQEVEILTDFKVKSKQVAALQKMGIPFFVNPNGRAIVSRAAIEGTMQALGAAKARTAWKSNAAK